LTDRRSDFGMHTRLCCSRFVTDDADRNYLIPEEVESEFLKWLDDPFVVQGEENCYDNDFAEYRMADC